MKNNTIINISEVEKLFKEYCEENKITIQLNTHQFLLYKLKPKVSTRELPLTIFHELIHGLSQYFARKEILKAKEKNKQIILLKKVSKLITNKVELFKFYFNELDVEEKNTIPTTRVKILNLLVKNGKNELVLKNNFAEYANAINENCVKISKTVETKKFFNKAAMKFQFFYKDFEPGYKELAEFTLYKRVKKRGIEDLTEFEAERLQKADKILNLTKREFKYYIFMKDSPLMFLAGFLKIGEDYDMHGNSFLSEILSRFAEFIINNGEQSYEGLIPNFIMKSNNSKYDIYKDICDIILNSLQLFTKMIQDEKDDELMKLKFLFDPLIKSIKKRKHLK